MGELGLKLDDDMGTDKFVVDSERLNLSG